MSRLRAAFSRVTGVFRARSLQKELAAELESHREMLIQANRERGLPEDEARRQAAIELSEAGVAEQYTQQGGLPFLDVLWQDLAYTLRMLRKSPGFALAAILTLALGIGGNTAIFSVVNGVLLQPLPYADPGRLLKVYNSAPEKGLKDYGASPPDFRELREHNSTLLSLSAFYRRGFNLTGADRPEHLVADVVSGEYFKTLGVSPMLGRAFDPGDEEWGKHQVMVLSEPLWRVRFHADREIIGKTFALSGETYTVVGVMPADFYTDNQVQLWVPMAWAPGDNMNSHNNYFANMVGRLKPGVSQAQATADLKRIMLSIATRFPENKGVTAETEPLEESIVGNIRPALELLLGAVGLILLIACVNVANLLLARSARRQKEIAVRAAMGAGRGRLIRQFLTESIVLGLIGGSLGLALAAWALRFVPQMQNLFPRTQQVRLDSWVLAFTALLSVITGILFGLVPAWNTTQVDLSDTLKQGGRSVLPGRNGLRRFLVGGETALALVLLISAGLAIKSFSRLLHVDRGFDPSRVLTFSLGLPDSYDPHPDDTRVGAPPAVAQFFQNAVERLEALPGVEAVGATTNLPVSGENWGKAFTPLDRAPAQSLDKVPLIHYVAVWGDYFRSMGIPVLQGRALDAHDAQGSPRAVVVSQGLARQFWPGQSPLGKVITLSPPESLIPANLRPRGFTVPQYTIVGVVADTHYGDLKNQPAPVVFGTIMQGDWAFRLFFVVRGSRNPDSLIAAAREQIGQIDPSIPLANIAPMEQILSGSVAQPRLESLVLGAFGGLALLLAAIGIFGVVSYSVAQRTSEIGIRMALGAGRFRVLRHVVWDGFRPAAAGLIVGLVLSFFSVRLMRSLLFGVRPEDPVTFTIVFVVLALVAVFACYLPARRAMRLDPMEALRQE